MKLPVLLPNISLRDAEVQQVLTYLKQNAPELETGLSLLDGKNIEEFITALKTSASASLDKYKDKDTMAKASDALALAIFTAARYRDVKYASANRKFLFGLGYKNAIVNSARTVFAKVLLEENAK
jgi:hypothetical protein